MIRFLRNDAEVGVVDFCDENLNLLAHAQSIELDVGSRCGGHGVCGGDRIQIPVEVRASLSTITGAEREHLSEAELAAGWRLACQCYPEVADLEFSAALK